MTSRVLAERVRALRLADGLSQSELGDLLKLSPTAVSRLEKGQVVDAVSTQAVAAALGCSVEVLTRPAPDFLHTKPLLRAYADASKRAVDRFVADTLLAVESFRAARLQLMPDTLPTFDGDANDPESIEEFAEASRECAGVADGHPVGNMARAAERLGCVLLPMPVELGRHLGLSMRVDDVPVIRSARVVPGDRQRFTFAHELGHLLLHADIAPPGTASAARQIELQAHRFAGAFLAPAGPLTEQLDSMGSRVTLNALAHLKRHWGVAIKALVVRFRQLDVIDDEHARSLYKQISARGWNKVEPVEVGNERAVWLAKAVAKRFADAGDPWAAFTSDVGLARRRVEQWQRWTPEPDMDADVIELRPRAATEVAVFGKPAPISWLPVGR